MGRYVLDTRLIELLVEQGIISDPKQVRKVTLEISATGEPVVARIEQYVERDVVETIVRSLSVVQPDEPQV